MAKCFNRSFWILVLAVITWMGFALSAQAGVNVAVGVNTADFGFLGNYGTWVTVPDHGRVWHPRVVAGWSPYSRGEWVWTDQGWTWISGEPYGWAVYHYGDWTFTPNYGWVWIPGYEWSPARVRWLYYGDYACWAPLGVRVRDPWVDGRFWTTVRFRDLDRRDVHRYVIRRPLAPARNVRVVWSAPAVHDFERITKRKVEVVRFNTTEIRGGNHTFRKIEVQRASPGFSGGPAAAEKKEHGKKQVKVKKTKTHKTKVKPHS
jgi:hypothetical protein